MKIREIRFNKKLSDKGFIIIPYNEQQFKRSFACRLYKVINTKNLDFEEHFTKEDLKKWALKELNQEVKKWKRLLN